MEARTITDEYRRMQQELHQNPNYGVASLAFAPLVADLIRQANVRSVSDYGAGKQNLRKALFDQFQLELDYRPYDPAFPEYGEPRPADLVCCLDVLEHIEPDFLDRVLDDLKRITVRDGLFSIHTGPAVKVLADGFECEGEKYKSLTAVAKAVTGKHWNGFHFFGLRKNGGDQ